MTGAVRAIGYVRVSTGEQGESGLGLKQVAAIRAASELRGWELIEVREEVKSGARADNRPVLAEVIVARGVRKVCHGGFLGSCRCLVLVDEPAEELAAVDAERGGTDGSRRALVWRLKAKRAVWPMPVVVVEVDAEDVVEVPAAQDQHAAVETFAPECPDPTFRVGVRVRRPHWCADDPDAFAAEHRVEVAAELAVAVVEQEPESAVPLAQLHHEVARLLCDPAACRAQLFGFGAEQRKHGEASPRPYRGRNSTSALLLE